MPSEDETRPERTTGMVVLTRGGASLGTATLTITEAAALLGVGRNLAYEVAARDGELAGVPVIRVGRRMLVPHARLLTVLGLHDQDTDDVGL